MIISYANDDKTYLSPHFNVQEFRCKCGQVHEILIDSSLISKLERIFTAINCSKIIVTSGYRCEKHDKTVGGSGCGQHTKGTAADIICYSQDGQPISSKKVCCAAQDAGFNGIANIDTSYTATHVDTRENGIWFGDEVVSTSYSVTDDFYSYYGINRNAPINAIIAKGIDVSYAQGEIDWNAVKESGMVDFAIIRAGYGRENGQTDAQFERNYSECRRLGIPVGLYWYSYAVSADEALQEAVLCLKTIAGKHLDYPLFIDIEEPEQLNKVTLNTVADAFCKTVSSAGYIAGLYCSTSYINEYLDNDFPYELWIAQFNQKNTCKFPYGIWQYGIAGSPDFDTFGTGSVPGVYGQCDMDYCYKSYVNTTSPDDSEIGESDVLKEILKHVRSIDEKI